jgi:hypothetical protein
LIGALGNDEPGGSPCGELNKESSAPAAERVRIV